MNYVLVLCLLLQLTTQSRSLALKTKLAATSKENDVIRKECSGSKVGLYRNPTNCSQYVSCSREDGKSTLKECKPRNNFHPEYKVCVWDKIYPCSATGKPVQKHETPVVAYCKGKSAGVYGDPQQCNCYVICTEEGAYHMQCPDGFLFDPVESKCTNTSGVRCNGVKSTTTPSYTKAKEVHVTATPTTAKKDVSVDKSSTTVMYTKFETSTFSCNGRKRGKYVISGACSYFYECTANGEAIVTSCLRHKNFHPVYQTCVWTYVYSCDEREFCKGKANGKYVNRNNCYGYYQCSDGMTFPRNCDPGLRFNGYRCVDASRYICGPPVKLSVVN